MNDPGHDSRQTTQTPHLSPEGPHRFCGDVALSKHTPPLIHISTSVHAGGVGLMKHEIA